MLSLLLPLTMYNWMRIYFYIHTHILLHRGNYWWPPARTTHTHNTHWPGQATKTKARNAASLIIHRNSHTHTHTRTHACSHKYDTRVRARTHTHTHTYRTIHGSQNSLILSQAHTEKSFRAKIWIFFWLYERFLSDFTINSFGNVREYRIKMKFLLLLLTCPQSSRARNSCPPTVLQLRQFVANPAAYAPPGMWMHPAAYWQWVSNYPWRPTVMAVTVTATATAMTVGQLGEFLE